MKVAVVTYDGEPVAVYEDMSDELLYQRIVDELVETDTSDLTEEDLLEIREEFTIKRFETS